MFSLFLSFCLSYGCFPFEIPPFSVSHSVSFSHPFCLFVSLCLVVSHPFLISPFGPPGAAAGKVLCLFPPHFLLLHSSAPVLLIAHLFPFHPSQLTSVLVCSSLFSIVHHGTALDSNTTKPQVKLCQVLN